MKDNKLYYIYMLRCKDNSLYTGITTNVKRRFEEHIKKEGQGAKYTRSRAPAAIEKVWCCASRSAALKLEYAIKKLTKEKKEKIIKEENCLNDFLADKLDIELYREV